MFNNVLLVNDDELTGLVYSQLLYNSGRCRRVTVKQNGREAIEYLAMLYTSQSKDNSVPDLILLDLDMPVMDGFEFLIQYKQLSWSSKHRSKVFILSSADTDTLSHLKDNFLGISGFLRHPLQLDTIQALTMVV